MAKREIRLNRADFITCKVTGEGLYRIVSKSEDGLEVMGGYVGENVVIGSDAWVSADSSISGSVYLLGRTLITDSTIYQTSLGQIEITDSNIMSSGISSSQAGRKICISDSILNNVTDIGGYGARVTGNHELMIVNSRLDNISGLVLSGILSNVKLMYNSKIVCSDEGGIIRLWCKDLQLDDYAVLEVEPEIDHVLINNVHLCEESRLYVQNKKDDRGVGHIVSVTNLKLNNNEKLWIE